MNETEGDECLEDQEAVEISSTRKPTTEIKEGMIAFKGIAMTKNSFLYTEESSGSACWNVDLLSTVDHAGTSPRESTPANQERPIAPPEKEL